MAATEPTKASPYRLLVCTSCHRNSVTIYVFHTVPPNPVVASIAMSGPPLIGSEFSLDCIVSEDITGLTNMPTAMWLGADNTPLTTGNDITITLSRSETVALATLTFNPLRASHGEGDEVYRCSGNLVSPALDSLIEVTTNELLTVKSENGLVF